MKFVATRCPKLLRCGPVIVKKTTRFKFVLLKMCPVLSAVIDYMDISCITFQLLRIKESQQIVIFRGQVSHCNYDRNYISFLD